MRALLLSAERKQALVEPKAIEMSIEGLWHSQGSVIEAQYLPSE